MDSTNKQEKLIHSVDIVQQNTATFIIASTSDNVRSREKKTNENYFFFKATNKCIIDMSAHIE